MPSPLKLRTFCNRMTKCYYFKEKNTYIKNATLLFKGILRKYSRDSSFLDIFSQNFSSKSYTGKSLIYSKDKKMFKKFCIQCANNINNFLLLFPPTEILYSYTFNKKLSGQIDIISNNKTIQFSFNNSLDTQKDIDFYILNNYIYNYLNKTSYDCIIMCVPTDTYFLVKYDKNDYTIRRGYIKSIINSKMRRRGDYCLNCSEQCKPTFINKLDRVGLYNDRDSN